MYIKNRFNYNEAMGVEACTQSLCDLALRFGEGGDDSMSRPFGVALLLAGNDKKKGMLVSNQHMSHHL